MKHSNTEKNIKHPEIFILILATIALFSYFLFNSDKPVNTSEIQGEVFPEESEIVENILEPVLLGKAGISFAGGTEGRAKNIELGVKKINGTIINPGEEFSFIETLGSVTEGDGYTEQKVFQNDEVTTGIGGGLCQVSTTLFQSIIDAGFPVTERKNHTYTVALYDVGLDATYAYPYVDLKFLNDSEYPIEIRGKIENEMAVFEIYGYDDGREVIISEPEISKVVSISPTKYVGVPYLDKTKPMCVNSPQIGYTAEVEYKVLMKNGEEREQIFTSTYKPLQKICYIETGMATTTFGVEF